MLVELGLQHEQQHQELLLMDLLDGFRQPMEPTYNADAELTVQVGPEHWLPCAGGLTEIGHTAMAFISTTRRHGTGCGWSRSS